LTGVENLELSFPLSKEQVMTPQEWRKAIHLAGLVGIFHIFDEQYVLVEIIEPGYDILDLREIITISQIMKVKRA
jgi:hypothetical protein